MRARDPLRSGFGPKRPPESATIQMVFGKRAAKVRKNLSDYLYVEMLRDAIGYRLTWLALIEAGRKDPKDLRGYVSREEGYRTASSLGKYNRQFMKSAPPWLFWLPTPLARKCMEIAVSLDTPLPPRVIELFDLKKDSR